MKQQVNRMKRILYGLINRPYIPEEILGREKLILHVSDTPVEIYGFLYQVVRALKPKDIIHTGDIADNYKIEFQKFHLSHYQEAVVTFFKRLREINEARLHVTMGNHDDPETISAMLPGAETGNRTIELYGKQFHLRHTLETMPDEPGIYCFGHKFDPVTEVRDDYILLNGLLTINVIDAETWEIFHLDYPIGTNAYRKMTNGRMKL